MLASIEHYQQPLSSVRILQDAQRVTIRILDTHTPPVVHSILIPVGLNIPDRHTEGNGFAPVVDQ